MSLLNSTTERPRPPVHWLPASPTEWLSEALILGILLFWLYYLTAYWDGLPAVISSGFNFAGRPRGSAPRSMLLLLPCLGVLLYVSLTVLSRFPHLHNLPVEVTPRNAAKIYNLSRWVLQLLKLELVASFGYIEWKMVQTARGNADGLHPWFMPVLLAAVLVTSLYPIFRMRRYQQG